MRTRLSYYKVRFHLGNGENYMKWQITKDRNPPNYVDPEQCRLVMRDCVLKNNKKLAKEIHQGSNKKVCAWVLCESLELMPPEETTPQGSSITYNPRKNPFWTDGISDLDDKRYPLISTSGKNLFADTQT